MFKLDNAFLEELGLGTLPAVEKNKMLAHIYETLEMRVGMKLAEQMSNEQLDEFESYINKQDEAGALRWLESNFPNYKQVVAEELEKLKGEVRQVAPQVLTQSAQANPAGVAQPAVQPQPLGQPQPPLQQQQGPLPHQQPAQATGYNAQMPQQPQQQLTPQQPQPQPQPQPIGPQSQGAQQSSGSQNPPSQRQPDYAQNTQSLSTPPIAQNQQQPVTTHPSTQPSGQQGPLQQFTPTVPSQQHSSPVINNSPQTLSSTQPTQATVGLPSTSTAHYGQGTEPDSQHAQTTNTQANVGNHIQNTTAQPQQHNQFSSTPQAQQQFTPTTPRVDNQNNQPNVVPNIGNLPPKPPQPQQPLQPQPPMPTKPWTPDQ